MTKILDVPYQSQIPYEISAIGQRKWCGIACMRMVLGYYLKDDAPTMDNLLEKYGQKIEDGGFAHKDFIKIGRDNGLRGFRKSWFVKPGVDQLIQKFKQEGENDEDIHDWEKTNIEESLYTLEKFIDNEVPVIMTVTQDFRPSDTTHTNINHLVVLIGIDGENFIIHDPSEKGESFKIKKEEFKRYWLRQAIIILKS